MARVEVVAVRASRGAKDNFQFRNVAAAFGVMLSLFFVGATVASAAEHALAGVHIFATSKDVLTKYGEPSQILTGANIGSASNSTASSSTSSSSMTRTSGLPAGIPSAYASMIPKGISLPGLGGSSGAPPEFSSAASSASVSTSASADTDGKVMYVYNRSDGTTLQFLLSPDGRVIQINMTGNKSGFKTTRSIGLGSTYSSIIFKYGYPESQETAGDGVLMIKYLDRQHVAFSLRNGKVIGISVAAIE